MTDEQCICGQKYPMTDDKHAINCPAGVNFAAFQRHPGTDELKVSQRAREATADTRCSTCGRIFEIGYTACDETMGCYCQECWPAVRCEELHGEACASACWFGDDDGPAALREAQETIRDALMDSQYGAGITAGWNAAQADDPEAALARLRASRSGYLAGFKEAKATLTRQQSILSESVNGEAVDRLRKLETWADNQTAQAFTAMQKARDDGDEEAAKIIQSARNAFSDCTMRIRAALPKQPVNLDGEAVERVARDMFNAYPIHAVSPALAEAAGVEVGTPLTYDFVLENGGNHDGLLRLARAAIASIRALTTTGVNNG